jgi:hypothetical protein
VEAPLRAAAVTEDETLELFRFFAEAEHTQTHHADSLLVRRPHVRFCRYRFPATI